MVKVFLNGEQHQFSVGLGKMSTENIKMNSWPSLPNKRRLIGTNQTVSSFVFGFKNNSYQKLIDRTRGGTLCSQKCLYLLSSDLKHSRCFSLGFVSEYALSTVLETTEIQHSPFGL